MTRAVGMLEFLSGRGPDKAAVIADLDGCLIASGRLLPHVTELFARCGDRLWIVSNNSSDTADTLSARLGVLGSPVPASHIVLAGEQTVRLMAQERPGQRIAIYATEPLCTLGLQLGLIPDRAAPDAAILARDPAFSFSCLSRLTAQVARGLPLMTTNPDASHPDGDGHPVPETGALWAALAAALPGQAIRTIGKPAPDLLLLALTHAGVIPCDAVFIGDTPETDGVAARSAGVEFVLLHRPGALATQTPEVQPC
jgi:HAD superfamily hydrolase (TIGR01450 family)